MDTWPGLAEERLYALRRERDRLRLRWDELEALAAEEREVQVAVGEAARALAGLEGMLRHGQPIERTAAIRQCMSRVEIDQPRGHARLWVLAIPNLAGEAVTEMTASL